MIRLIGLWLVLILILNSCQAELNKEKGIAGTWESIGSGWVLQIEDSIGYSFYDLTSISCLARHSGPTKEILADISLIKDTLVLRKGVLDYSFVRVSHLPELCYQKKDSTRIDDPLFNFEVFAETVKHHYAFFDLNGLNWDGLYQEQKQKLSQGSNPVQLYQVLEETLERLNDNHAYLEAPSELYQMMPADEEETTTQEDELLPQYGDFQVADLVANHHLQEDMTQDSWLIKWGKLTEDIGYVQIKAMWLYADLDIDTKLIEEVGYVDAYVETFHKMYEGDYINREVEGVRQIMDRVMSDLQNMEAIVMDVRFNGGGQDAVSFEILNRFTEVPIQVATQKLRDGDYFTPVQPLFLSGSKKAFKKPVYVLTSPQTGSAAEAFAIATLDMDQIQRIGSPTSGAMSTALEKTLPNGWVFSISNEIYMDNNGIGYENIGIPVNSELNYPRDRQVFFRSVVDNLDKDMQDILTTIAKLNSQ